MKVKLTNSDKFAYVDKKDYSRVSKHSWYLIKSRNTEYATSKTAGKLHRFIMKADKKDSMVDHKDRNGLNNRSSNLRFATNSQNKMNQGKFAKASSKFKGVTGRKGTWKSQIKKDNQLYYLGTFKSQLVAAIAYNEKAKILFGEYACLNKFKSSNEKITRITGKLNRGFYLPKFSSAYEGVTYCNRDDNYMAYVYENKKQVPLGWFKKEKEAARVVQEYYDLVLNMNADVIKLKILHYWRFCRKFDLCATEVGKYHADVLVSNWNTHIEIEVKTSKYDLRNEFKKPKHTIYQSKNVKSFKQIPNKFYIAVDDSLKEEAVKLLKDTPYGLIIIDSKKINNKRRKTFASIEKSAKLLTSKYCTKLERVLIKRLSSELVQSRINAETLSQMLKHS